MKNWLLAFVLSVSALFPTDACQAEEYEVMRSSWYGPGLEGNRMPNGRIFRSSDPTVAAHKTLPLGTPLWVTNPRNGKTLIVIVQDRGPYIRGRQLDLSRAAADKLGYLHEGVTPLHVTIITKK